MIKIASWVQCFYSGSKNPGSETGLLGFEYLKWESLNGELRLKSILRHPGFLGIFWDFFFFFASVFLRNNKSAGKSTPQYKSLSRCCGICSIAFPF